MELKHTKRKKHIQPRRGEIIIGGIIMETVTKQTPNLVEVKLL